MLRFRAIVEALIHSGSTYSVTIWQQWARRVLLAVAFAAIAFLLYSLVTRTDSGAPPVVATPTPLDAADAGMQQFVFRQTKDGAVQWEVKAQHASLFEERNEAHLSGVQVALLGAKGKELTVEGEEAQLNTATKDFTLSNRSTEIPIRLESGYVVYSNHLHWTDTAQELSTADAVRIEGNGLRITGQGLRGQLDREEFQVLHDVQVDVLPSRQ